MGGLGPPADLEDGQGAAAAAAQVPPLAHVQIGRSGSHSKEPRNQPWAAKSPELRQTRALGAQALVAALCWVTCSSSIILLNKRVLSHYKFSAVNTLLAYHCAIAVALLRGAQALGLVEIQPLTRDVLALWLPLNCIFVAMLATALKSLGLLGVGVMSLLKNLTNIFIISGDYAMMGRAYTWHVYACLAIMVVTAAGGAATDVAFSGPGYAWQLLNCLFTAAYALYLSHVTQRLSASAGTSGRRVNEASMAYYNNLLSIPLAVFLMFFGEAYTLADQPALRDASFQVYAFLGGVLGLGISFFSIWFMSLSSATMYTLTGSCNKFLVAFVGIWAFNESREPRYVASIVLGLAAGGLLPFVKMKQKVPPPQQQDKQACPTDSDDIDHVK